MENGFVALHRKFLKWEWYDDINTKSLFIHLLLKVNHSGKKWRGIEIVRGSCITGRKKLALETGLSEQQIRTCLKKLKSTNEITITTSREYSLIAINKYNDYQSKPNKITNNQPPKQPTTNQRPTTNNNVNNNNNIKECFENEEVNIIFNEFLNIRKKLKAVNSERAINTLLNTLNKFDDDIKIKMIEKSIVNSWKTVYELKPSEIPKKNKEVVRDEEYYRLEQEREFNNGKFN